MEVREVSDGGDREVWITLDRTTRRFRCGGCGKQRSSYHDGEEREIRDLPILGVPVRLFLWRFRVECPSCGPRLEALDWLAPRSRVSARMAEDVARLCRVLPIKHVAERFGLDWSTVKAIDKAWLARTLPELDMAGVEQLIMDEFAIHKGHRYATVISDAATRRVLWVGHGRGRGAVRPFFEGIGKEACGRIRAVAMDMHAPFEVEVRAQCQGAEIVYDLFHVVMKYGREVIDRVRVNEANRLKSDKAARKVVKGSKWLLLANRDNLATPGQRVRLKELLKANEALMTVYLLKDDLKQLWSYTREGWARRAWEDWLARAQESGIAPLKTFARNLAKRIDGILAHCRWDLNTSVLEGMNNKIKVLKRMAYGFRDDDYFFLKIRSAFPGVSR
jgi:transposase